MSEHKKKRLNNKQGRHGHDKPVEGEREEAMVDENAPGIKLFRVFQHELDGRYDKHERIVKLSRDITIESKRTIFLLHRLDLSSNSEEILAQADEKLRQIENTKFKDVAKELVGCDHYQFLRAYSAGLQEYIEAVTFFYYLKENRLMSLSELEERLVFDEPQDLKDKGKSKADIGNGAETKGDDPTSPGMVTADDAPASTCIHVTVPPVEFILGIADLTGELMRKAINSVGAGDLSQPFKICGFLQELESACTAIGFSSRELNRKIFTLRQSLRKVESACYTLQVRGSEIPKHMLVDALSKATVTPYMEDSMMNEDD